MTQPDDEHRPSASCEGLRYSLEWSWRILGSSSAAKAGTLRALERAGGDDHLARLVAAVAGDRDERLAIRGGLLQPLDPDAGVDRGARSWPAYDSR